MRPLLTASVLALAAALPAVENLTTSTEVLGSGPGQLYGMSSGLVAAAHPVLFQGLVYGGYGNSNNTDVKPIVAYDPAQGRFINDMPLQHTQASQIGSHHAAFRVLDEELYMLDYDSQESSVQYRKGPGGWWRHTVGGANPGDGSGKGHDTDVHLHDGVVYRERGLWIDQGSHATSTSLDRGASWQIPERPLRSSLNRGPDGLAAPARYLPHGGAMWAMAGSTQYGDAFTEGRQYLLGRSTGDLSDLFRPMAWQPHHVNRDGLDSYSGSNVVEIAGRVLVYGKSTGWVTDRLVGNRTITPVTFPVPLATFAAMSPSMVEEGGLLWGLFPGGRSSTGGFTFDRFSATLASSPDGVTWTSVAVWNSLPAEPKGFAKSGDTIYLGTTAGLLLRAQLGRTAVPPVATLGSVAISGSLVNVSVSATDSDGAVASIEVFAGLHRIGTIAGASGTVAWTAPYPGVHQVTAVAVDSQGLRSSTLALGTGTTAIRAATVSDTGVTGAPRVWLLDRIDSGYQAVGGVGRRYNVGIHARDSDFAGTPTTNTHEIAKVELFSGAVKVGEALPGVREGQGNGRNRGSINYWEIAWSEPVGGTHVLTAVATDIEGVSTTSTPVTVTLLDNPQAPTVSLVTPTGPFLARRSISLSATASDPQGIAYVDFLADGRIVGHDTTAPYTATWAEPRAGTVALSARAVDVRGRSTTTTPVNVVVPPQAATLGSLSVPVATITGSRSATITWSGSTTGADRVHLERRLGTSVSAPWLRVATLPASATSFDDLTLATSTATTARSYGWRVRLSSDEADGPWSTMSTTVTTAVAPTVAPSAPVLTSVTALSPHVVYLVWNEGSNTETMAVTYTTTGQFGSTCIGYVPASQRRLMQGGFAAGKTYTFKLFAHNAATDGRLSAPLDSAVSGTITVTMPTTGTSHTLTVVGGQAEASTARQGSYIGLSADAAPSGQVFAGWTFSVPTECADHRAVHTAVFMPSSNLTATATWRDVSLGSTPVVSSTSPTSMPGTAGTLVTVTGASLGGTTAMTIGGLSVTSLSVSGSQVTGLAPTLTNGTHAVVLTVAGSSLAAGSITVDATAPAVPVITTSPVLVTTATPVVGGTAEAGTQVEVTIGGVTLSPVAVSGTSWSRAVGTLADGAYTIQAVAIDAVGNRSGASASVVLVVDTTAPATPAAPIASQSGASVSLSGTGTSGDVIRVFRGGVLLGSTTVVAGSWSYDAGLQADGTHTFTTVAVDPAGNVSGTSSATTVTVVTPSTVTAVSPTTVAGTGGTTITLTGTNLTATTAVTLGGVAATGVSVINATTVRCVTPVLPDGTAALGLVVGGTPVVAGVGLTVDAVAPAAPVVTSALLVATGAPTLVGTREAAVPVEVAVDGVVVGTVTGTGTAWSQPLSGLTEGMHAVAVTAIDAVGNRSATTTGTLEVDLTAPSVPVITGPTSSSTQDVTLVGTGTEGAVVTVQVDGHAVGQVTVAGGAWTLDLVELLDGVNRITVSATDAAGNASAASAAWSLTVDTTAPSTPTLTTSLLSASATPTVGGTAEAGVTVAVNVDGVVAATVVVPGSGLWNATLGSALSDGPHDLVLSARDAFGHVSTFSTPVALLVDTTAPAMPSMSTALLSGSQVTLSGTGTEGEVMRLLRDGTVIGTVTVAGGVWSFTTDPLPEGTAGFTVVAMDAAGNASVPSATVTVVTVIPPTATGVLPATVGGAGGQTITVTGTRLSGTSAVLVGGQPATMVQVVDATTVTAVVPALPDGPATIVLTVDAAPVTASVSVQVDATAPAMPVATLPTSVTGSTMTVSGRAEAAATVRVIVDGLAAGHVVADGSGSWSVVVTGLSQGTHALAVTAEDAFGQTSAALTGSVQVVIDGTAPATPTVFLPTMTRVADLTLTGLAEAGATVTVWREGSTAAVATATVTAGGSFQVVLPILPEGTSQLRVTVTDAFGNVSPAFSGSVVVDSVAPAAPTAPTVTLTTAGLASFRGTVPEGATTVLVLVDGVAVASAAPSATGTWHVQVPVASGTRQVTVVVLDAAGNASAASPALTIRASTGGTPDPGTPADAAAASDTAGGCGLGGGLGVVLAGLLVGRRRRPV